MLYVSFITLIINLKSNGHRVTLTLFVVSFTLNTATPMIIMFLYSLSMNHWKYEANATPICHITLSIEKIYEYKFKLLNNKSFKHTHSGRRWATLNGLNVVLCSFTSGLIKLRIKTKIVVNKIGIRIWINVCNL